MHELLLYGQVPRARHEQVLKVLAGLAGMQPHRVLKRHVVYKPLREPDEPGSQLKRGGTQAIQQGGKQVKQAAQKDIYFTQLVRPLVEEEFDSNNGKQQADANSLVAKDGTRWFLEFNDVPEPGDRGGVLVRLTNSSEILEGDAHEYMVSGGNQFVSEYYVEGHRLVYDNVVIFLHRVLHEPGVRSLETVPKATLPNLEDLKPFDPSGAYIFEAKIRVQDINNAAVTDTGVEELNRFRNQMKGCVELSAPDRLLLDTRVRWKPKTVAR